MLDVHMNDLVLNASLQNCPIDGALSGYLRDIALESSKNALFQCYSVCTTAIILYQIDKNLVPDQLLVLL
jgi:hypothetical protein